MPGSIARRQSLLHVPCQRSNRHYRLGVPRWNCSTMFLGVPFRDEPVAQVIAINCTTALFVLLAM
jgi:hypothetical protein